MWKAVVKRALQGMGLSVVRHKPRTSFKFAPDPSDELKWIAAVGIQTVLDIGAHSGESARQFRSILPEAFIHSFEPLPEQFARLTESMAGDQRFAAWQVALGEKTERADMLQNEFAPSSSILPMASRHREEFPFTEQTKKIAIEVKRLDDAAERLATRPKLLVKIDTQGFEDRVIRGGEKTIMLASIVIIEVSFTKLYEGQPLFSQIYDQMRSLGFDYAGALHQLRSPKDGQPLQADAIFLKN